MEEIRNRKNEIIKIIGELGARIEALKGEKAALAKELDEARRAIEGLKGDLSSAEGEKRALLERIDGHLRDIEGLKVELKASKDSFDEIFGALQDVNRTVRKMAME